MKRREFVAGPLAVSAVAGSSVMAQATPVYDTVLKGGHVIDLANQINQPMDVAVLDGKIAKVDRNIPGSAAKKAVNVAGYYVTPGLIDLHICCFYTRLDLTPSVIADHHCLPSGVTTTCDGGTAGADSFEDFKKIIGRSKMRILSFLNIAAPGAQAGGAEQDPAQFKVQLAAETAKKYPQLIVGFKTGHYGGKFSETRPPWASMDAVLEAGRLTNLPILADFTPQPAQGKFPARSYREFLLEKMRPGDIVTHCLADRYAFLQADGTLNPDVNKARARGVKFDLGHAAGSFSFRRVIPAIEQGFIPDSISADLFADTPYTVGINLAYVMSKFLALGVPFEEILRRTTVFPAQMIKRPELGNLSVGSTADVAVLEIRKGKFAYLGSFGGKVEGNRKIECVMTMVGGKILYDHPYGLSVPNWKDIPKDSKYWADTTQQKF
ncbi:MAG: amidohydrolase/deacetylase family metallohydrolase [Bryobacterales bacterium]|nr:amidohydrolase/deacetylase family metallohydrolase [Bryobacterales bacterium]